MEGLGIWTALHNTKDPVFGTSNKDPILQQLGFQGVTTFEYPVKQRQGLSRCRYGDEATVKQEDLRREDSPNTFLHQKQCRKESQLEWEVVLQRGPNV